MTCCARGQPPTKAPSLEEGLFTEQTLAEKRFHEKFGRTPESFLFVCDDCQRKNPYHTKKAEEKYGVYE